MPSLNFNFHPRWRAVLAACSRRLGCRHRRCVDRRVHEPRADEGGPYVGWFDSSQDLLSGLAVTEHGDPGDGLLPGAVFWWEDCVSV